MRNVLLRNEKGTSLSFDELDNNFIETSWNYVIISDDYNARNRDFCLVDTTIKELSILLPAHDTVPNGSQIRFLDIKSNFEVNNLIVLRNSNTIMGLFEDLIIDSNNASFTLLYINGDWRLV